MPTRTESHLPETEPDAAAVRLARRRFARRQWARRWLAWRTGLVVLLVLGLAAGAVWLVFFSTVLAVRGVQVVGAEVLAERTVRRTAAVPTGAPLASVDLEAVGARVRALDPVLRVDVSRAWPDRVRVQVTERTAVAVVEQNGVLHGFDADGVLFRTYPSRPPRLPLVQTTPGTPPDALAEVASVVGSLPRRVGERVAYLRVQSVDAITLQLRDGRTVMWGSAQQSADKSRVLEALLDRKARWYDVSVPGRPAIRR